ncbi:hypothetical protein FOZ63_002597, partial [Perkinsus olseni]
QGRLLNIVVCVEDRILGYLEARGALEDLIQIYAAARIEVESRYPDPQSQALGDPDFTTTHKRYLDQARRSSLELQDQIETCNGESPKIRVPSNAPIEKIFDNSAKRAPAITKDELVEPLGMVDEILRVLGRDRDFTEEQMREFMQKVADIEKDIKPVATGPKPRMFQLQLSEESTKNLRDV